MAPPRPSPVTRPDGFSLVELMVVLVVLAIAAALVVPRMGSASSSRLTWAAQVLAADLQMLQSDAMAHPDETRVLDFALNQGISYELAKVRNNAAKADNELLWNALTNRAHRVSFGQDGHEHLEGVWLAKSNLGPDGHLEFGRYGQVEQFSVDPTMVLAAGENTLTVTVAFDTGEVTIGSTFTPLSQLGSIAVPGATGLIQTVASSPY